MQGKIPQQFIDDLVARADIVEVINRRVPLKKAGHEYKACCPFHDEKTPSFTVSPNKQFYHCFGCGQHGTAIGFLMEFDRLSYPEAIESLADDLGLQVPRDALENRGPDLSPLYDLLGRAEQFYENQLRRHPEASRAVDYLRGRGLSGEISARFRIGFAPPGWDNLIRQLGTSRETNERLGQCGLTSEREQGGAYDRLRDRIIFPIHDARGRVIGFGGRVLDDGTPKYLNSPETPVFHKGRELYGLYEAKQANRQLDSLLVVEGYMDVVALAQYGIDNAVATLGTATTADHVDKMFRQVPQLVFCFDGDRAGRDAAWKALNTVLPYMRDGRQARFLFLPDGEDPDSLVREQGAERFREIAANAESLSAYLFRQLSVDLDLSIPEGRASLAEQAKPLIAQVPTGVFRELLTSQLADQVKTRQLGLESPNKTPRRHAVRDEFRPRSLMQQIIALTLQYPDKTTDISVPEEFRGNSIAGAEILTRLLDTTREYPHITLAGLIEHWSDEKTKRTLGTLAQARFDLAADTNIRRQIQDGIDNLLWRTLSAELKSLSARGLSSLTPTEKQRLRELSQTLASKKTSSSDPSNT